MNREFHANEEWLPLSVAAHKLGTTPLNALMFIKRGLLVGQEDEENWLIDPVSLSAFLNRHGQGELPAVCQSGCSKSHGCGGCG